MIIQCSPENLRETVRKHRKNGCWLSKHTRLANGNYILKFNYSPMSLTFRIYMRLFYGPMYKAIECKRCEGDKVQRETEEKGYIFVEGTYTSDDNFMLEFQRVDRIF